MKYIILIVLSSVFLFSDLFSQINLPQDHSLHSDYKIEWCYFVSILQLPNDQKVGVELSFFRYQLNSNDKLNSGSPSLVKEIFPVHFAISDINNGKHYTSQVMGRKIGGLSEYSDKVLKVHDFRMEILGDSKFRIFANPRFNQEIGIDLNLSGEKDNLFIHGVNGISKKSNLSPKFFSKYYSMTRLKTSGTVTLNGSKQEVLSGYTWMDHEWSQGDFNESNNSWDWVGLSLDDGSDWMAFRFKANQNAEAETFGSTKWNQTTKTFEPNLDRNGIQDLQLVPNMELIWKSPVTGNVYPMEWRLTSITEKLDIIIKPYFKNQEFDGRKTTGLAYWEGAVTATGTRNGRIVNGQGYLELKGYGKK
ncbi:lipocalin-like domain-containing protein [Leptospira sp. GIMC2001]|uniref:lipocalin-like domain-containing protein n=1 Tax=Leptospira sp. GIMC2001 TaxID=1513297 RepID=UPI0023493119|nr:lipocalin-like domain-containing protein [Leptospira sp. GIMC2001]WCL48543.1 carotenoid 1,2-hydratase [Leptospira sp. GIMC2001]